MKNKISLKQLNMILCAIDLVFYLVFECVFIFGLGEEVLSTPGIIRVLWEEIPFWFMMLTIIIYWVIKRVYYKE